MRIVISTLNRNLIGGTEKYLQTLIPGLLGRGHEVGLIYEERFNDGWETIDSRECSLETWCLADLGPAAVLHQVSKWKPDIIYNQGLKDGAFEDGLVTRFPSLLFAHNYYGTCVTGTKCHAFPQARPCERRFGPACLLLHYPRRCGGLNPITTWRLFKHQAGRNVRLTRYGAILVASTHMRREFLRHGLRPDQVCLLPLPSTDDSAAGMPREASDRRSRVLLVGRLTALKGGHYLVEAVAKASGILGRPLTLTVAGDGPERSRLENLAKRFGVATEFAGWVNAARRIEILSEMDLLAVPSLWPEPFGLVGVEAGALGVPAVGYAVGGILDWLIPGQTGEVAPGDPPTVDGLSAAIARALADPGHYRELCRGARLFSRHFNIEPHLTKLEQIMRDTPGPLGPG
jgi:glycosyltransferase involved in cell wall biosynthesis